MEVTPEHLAQIDPSWRKADIPIPEGATIVTDRDGDEWVRVPCKDDDYGLASDMVYRRRPKKGASGISEHMLEAMINPKARKQQATWSALVLRGLAGVYVPDLADLNSRGATAAYVLTERAQIAMGPLVWELAGELDL